MRLAFSASGWEDYLYWQSVDRKTLERINDLISDVLRHPFEGIGKPEPLKGKLRGFWSRRINQEHRLVYEVVGTGQEQTVVIAQCRYHY
ncbi:Txe/YoeB family addiction module toxin [Rhizobium sp. RU36D]|uniref:Txe/YoeB family addiction module toxin n=1 Tax=Rhizobium sp. RU36D TaxID=1907415 RepID=UPI0009D80BC1|nr:Txe/YoeB family addiction module toxin [Rhizobium sp. RU36D]SMD03328.1 toxin YoeB [Rhizobium sp. RU36D]